MSRWTILVVLSLIRLSFGYQFESMATLAPAVARDLGFDQAQAGTLIGLYWAPGVVVALPGGWLGRRFGDKSMVLAGGLLTVLGGLLCAFGESYAALAAGRLIAGLGGIVMNILAVKMATDWFAGREIGFALGALFGSFPLGIALGLGLQAPLALAIGWPAVMLSTAALGAAVAGAIAFVYRAPSAVAQSGAPANVVFLSRREIALMSMAGIGLALYNGSFLVYVSYAPALLVSSGLGVAETSAVLAAGAALSTLCVPLGGHLADRSGRPRAVLYAATAAFCVFAMLMPAVIDSHGLLVTAAFTLGLSALGALPVSAMVALPAQATAPASRALGLGVFYTWFYLGAALCPALGGWLYQRTGASAAPVYLVAGLAFLTLALYRLFDGMLGRWPR